MKPPTSILAPTDLSDSSIPALRYSRLFAQRFLARLTVLYVDPVIYPIDYLGHAPGAFISTTPEHQARLRREVQEHADPVMNGQPYEVEVAVGQPIPSILDFARVEKSDLIVMGTHLRHGWRRALLGSVSDGVIHGSECPVITVARDDRFTGAAPYAITNILCPINFTDVARQSLQEAASLAEAFNAKLTIVHVLEPGESTDATMDETRVRMWVAPELQDICLYRELVVRGGAAERVLDCADDIGCDLLVIGAQHKLFRDDTVIGTTTERLIRFSSCPVMVVPRPAAPSRHRVEEAKALAGVTP